MSSKIWKMHLICEKYNLDERRFNYVLDALIDPTNELFVKRLQDEELLHLVPVIVKDISDSGVLD